MPTRTVVLSEHQHELVAALVQPACYQNASEAMREGLRFIEERARIEPAKLTALEQATRQGWADVLPGDTSMSPTSSPRTHEQFGEVALVRCEEVIVSATEAAQSAPL